MFLYEGIEWLRWLVGFWFFLLGLSCGWWHWGYRNHRKSNSSEVDEKNSKEEEAGGSYGLAFEKKPEDADDLAEIEGISVNLQGKLNGVGVYQFSQLANLEEPNIEALRNDLDLGEDIEISDWVKQARDLVKKSEKSGDEK